MTQLQARILIQDLLKTYVAGNMLQSIQAEKEK
jgi:hypothetical protein